MLKRIAHSPAVSDTQRWNGVASRFRNERPPMVKPFERVRKKGYLYITADVQAYTKIRQQRRDLPRCGVCAYAAASHILISADTAALVP